jgi:hypothetical protein
MHVKIKHFARWTTNVTFHCMLQHPMALILCKLVNIVLKKHVIIILLNNTS